MFVRFSARRAARWERGFRSPRGRGGRKGVRKGSPFEQLPVRVFSRGNRNGILNATISSVTYAARLDSAMALAAQNLEDDHLDRIHRLPRRHRGHRYPLVVPESIRGSSLNGTG